MTKARNIANIASDGSALADGTINYTDVSGTPTLANVATSGSFNDLSNQPAAFDPATLAAVAVSGSFNDLLNQPTPFNPATLATVAVSGSYTDLINNPTLGTAAATNATAYATAAQGTLADSATQPGDLAAVATSGAYSSLSGKPTLGTAAATNATAYATAAQGTLADTATQPGDLAAVATSGAYSSLSGTPALAAVATSGAYSSLSGTPALAAVATSGAYSSLSGTPAAALPLTGGTLSGTLTLNGALNGVTSVNATTAAAMTAAGIGAPFTWNVLATQTDSSQVMAPWTSSNLSVTMPNYSAISHIAIVLTYDLYTTESWNYYFSIYLTDQDYLGQSDGNQYKMQYLHNLGEPANTWVNGNNILMICEISPQFSLTATGNEGPVLEPYNNFETYGVAARGGYTYAGQGYYQLKDSRIAPNGTWTTKVKHYYYGGSGGYTRNRVLKVYARYTL